VNLCDALTDDELRVLMRWVCDHQVSLLAAVRWFVVSGLTLEGAAVPVGSLVDACTADVRRGPGEHHGQDRLRPVVGDVDGSAERDRLGVCCA
jgi:hypothetical protein